MLPRDVVVAGVSIVRYTELCGTPCVMSGPATIPSSGGIPSSEESTSIVVFGIVAVDITAGTVCVDADLDAISPVDGELRMIARVSHAHDRSWIFLGRSGEQILPDAPALPADLRCGDWLALTCPGTMTVGALHASHETR